MISFPIAWEDFYKYFEASGRLLAYKCDGVITE